jgi:flagellar protein FliO/FliZ
MRRAAVLLVILGLSGVALAVEPASEALADLKPPGIGTHKSPGPEAATPVRGPATVKPGVVTGEVGVAAVAGSPVAVAVEPGPPLPPGSTQMPGALEVHRQPPAADVELPRAEPPELAGEEVSLGWTLLRTCVVLGIVILSIYITLNFGLRRLMGIAAPASRGQSVVQVLERIPLDQKRSMFVVRAAGEYLLIGGGEGALQLIAKLDPAEVEKLQQQPPPTLSLSPLLQKLLKRRPEPAPPAPGDNS